MFNFAQNYLNRGFWGDEAWTSLISQLPYFQMLKTTAADFHPPGYYTVVELVYKFFPPTEIVTRAISFFFYILTILTVYFLAKEIKGRKFGLISAIVTAVNPIFFTYAFEARNYTMFAFAATGSIYTLIRLSSLSSKKESPLKGDSLMRWRVVYVFFSTLGIYTHYYMFFVLASQGIFVLLFNRTTFLKMLVPWIAIFTLYLPWIPFLFGQLTTVGESYWIGSINTKTHYEALLRILSGEHKTFFQPFLFSLSLGLLGVGVFHHLFKRGINKFEKPYLLIWLWAVVPFILASLPGLKVTDDLKLPFRPIFFWRYLIGASVPFAMLIVHAAQRLNGNLYKISVVLIVGLSIAIDVLTFQRFPATFKQVYENSVIPDIKTTDTIVTNLPSFAEVLYYRNYFGLNNKLVVLPEGLVQSSGKSLLDAYVANGDVTIEERPGNQGYFEITRDSNYIPRAELVISD